MAIDSILSLPLEIMVAILSELDYPDILVCSRVRRIVPIASYSSFNFWN